MMVREYVCFFNDTATTEIYMKRHKFSLHDSIPSSNEWASEMIAEVNATSAGSASRSATKLRSILTPSTGTRRRWLKPEKPVPKRSEEHTSELQSLMRISYAVFCLKKKKSITI